MPKFYDTGKKNLILSYEEIMLLNTHALCADANQKDEDWRERYKQEERWQGGSIQYLIPEFFAECDPNGYHVVQHIFKLGAGHHRLVILCCMLNRDSHRYTMIDCEQSTLDALWNTAEEFEFNKG